MWRLVLTVVLWNNISSQPVTDDLHSRPSRQVDFIECCPCLGSNRAGLQDLGAAASTPRAAVDDCPCRLRDTDSQGSPSVFLPRAVRPVRPFITDNSPKEDTKPLLKPEVGLASSMLATLREVTDEEYQEALARDAARNAARVAELGDAQPDTAKSVVTIIVNPRGDEVRDATHEASQPFETRCILPSGASNLGQVREADRSTTFKLQPNLLGRSLLDMDSGASEVQKSVVSLNKGLEGLKLKTSPSLLKLFPPKKSEGGNVQSLLKLKNNKLPKNAADEPKKLDGSLKPKLPSLKLPSLFRINENSSSIKPLGFGTNKLNIPKIRTNLARKPKVDRSGNEDSNPSPSSNQEQFSHPIKNKDTSLFDLKSLLPAYDFTKTPLNLKHLLNLKDVELIPPKSPKIILPDLKLLPTLQINKPETKFVKRRKNERLTEKCNTTAKENEEGINVQRNNRIHTEILDAIPHASNNPMLVVNNIDTTNFSTDKTNLMPEKGNIKTEILDALPSASEYNEVVNLNGIETSTPRLEEETTNSNGDLEPQHFQEIVTESANTLSKDNVENLDSEIENEDANIGNMEFNDNNEEFVIDVDGNSRFEELDIEQDPDQPISENDFSDIALDTGNEGLDIEIDEYDANVSPSTFIISTDQEEPILIEGSNQEVNEFESEPIQDMEELEFGPVQETQQGEEFDFDPEQEANVSEDSTNRDLFFRQNSIDQDAVGETSNQNIQTISTELPEVRGSDSPNDSLSVEDSSQSVPKSDLLSSIKERISLKLKSLKTPDKSILTISMLNQPESSSKNIEDNQKSSLNSDETIGVKPLTEDTEKFIVDEKSAELESGEINQVNMQDLQNMSDSLLRKSEKEIMPQVSLCGDLKKKTISVEAIESERKQKTSLVKENSNEETDSDMDSSATSITETFDSNEGNDEDIDSDENGVDNAKTESIDSTLNTEDNPDTLCPSNLHAAKTVSSGQKLTSDSNLDDTEMASGASETVFNTLPPLKSSSSPLLQQSIVVQPASLFPPIPSLDLSNVNLPTLDDIRQGISNVFNARTADDEKTSSPNLDSMDDCPDSNPIMSSDASTTNSKSVFQPLKSLEDINLDIFQINPLSQSQGSSLLKMPSLNLNSFRTKLALPKSLDLKPMKLQSALGGRNGGLLGATLTLGPDKSSSRKTKPVTMLGSILNRQGSDILGNPLSNMPSLEDLRSTMKTNAMSLFKSPLVNPLDDTLRSTEAFSNSIRSHTENTIRNIQQSLSSTINNARVNSAGETFAKPQELLERVSLAHEDVKDKLYGIHVDLQDRLSSIHDRILDQSNLQIPTLQTPFLSGLGMGRLQDIPSGRSRARNDLKKTPSPKLIVKKRKPTATVTKTTSKNKEQNKVKPFKISKAASSLIPKTVVVPKLLATSSKPPFLRPLQRDQSVKLKETKPIFANDERTKIKPFGVQTKVTISTTPRPASFRTRPSLRPQLRAKPISINNEQPTRLKNQRVKQFKSFNDARGFASESQSIKVPAPVKPSVELSTFNSEESWETLRKVPLPSSTLPEFSLGNPLFSRANTLALKPISLPLKLTSSKTTLTPLTLPKPTESPIASKMREAIRIRFSRPVHSTDKLRKEGLTKAQAKQDMASSASEGNVVSARIQPMKENVSYKCKMVCVRE